MKKAKISKSLIIILLVVFPTTILFGSILTTVHAGPYVPEEHVNNEWYWNVNEGELLMYELEFIMTNATTYKEKYRLKDLMIFNITSFQNITTDYPSYPYWDPGQSVSRITTDIMKYNLALDDLEIVGPSWPLAAFGYNDSHPMQLKITGYQHIPPLILPLNGTNNLQVDILTDVINETLFDPLAVFGKLNYFDYFDYNVGENSTYFSNTTHNYFINATYYGNNGTLKYGEGFIKMRQDTTPDSDILLNMSVKRVFDYNVTDEIEWGFKEGDSIYLGTNLPIGSMEMKIDIVKFNYSEYAMPAWYGGGSKPMVFQDLLVNISTWNETTKTYILDPDSINFTAATANNFYPVLPNTTTVYIIPNNTRLGDLRFLFNNNTQDYNPAFPFDIVYIYEDPNGDIISEMVNTSRNFYTYSHIDIDSGCLEYLYMTTNGIYNSTTFRKNMTVITSQLEANDVWLYSEIIGNCQTYVNFTYPGVDVELYWAALPISHVAPNATFPYEIPNMPVYLDLYSNNTEALDDYPINMTFYYDDSKLNGLLEKNLVPSFFNTTTQAWELMPGNFYSIDTSLNRVDMYGFEYSLATYQYFAIGCIITPPEAFILTSNAGDPDDDGIFTLSWDTSLGATNYTVYRHSGYITEINSSVTQILISETTNLALPLSGYTDGTYYFIVIANNTAGSILSNCIKVIVQIPTPPLAFTLTSNAGDPDDDGVFTLSWGSSVGATNYSVYQYSGYITVINSSVTEILSETTNLTLPLSGYTNGTYYFIVVATNNLGSTLSNCLEIVVQIPPSEEEEEEEEPFIPGYDIFIIIISLAIVSALWIKKRRKRVIKK